MHIVSFIIMYIHHDNGEVSLARGFMLALSPSLAIIIFVMIFSSSSSSSNLFPIE